MSWKRRRPVGIAAFFLAVSLLTAQGAAGAPAGRLLHVAVYYDQGGSGQALVDVLNAVPGLRAVEVTQSEVESGGLAGFDCVVARLFGPPETGFPTAATVEGIQNFVASGGGYVGEWWGAGAALIQAVPSIDGDYYVPGRFLGLFAGGASDGGMVQTDNPITLVAHHPVVKGLPHVWSGAGGTEFFVRPVGPFDPDLLVVATYQGHGGTNPAIMAGTLGSFSTGTSNAVLLFFDAIDDPTNPNLARLWTNSARFACAHQPRI
jgi:hypothetical protein